MPTQSVGTKKYTDALLQSMDALAKTSVETSTAKTLTLEAKITEVVDEGLGKYKVQYLDNIFYAFSSNEAIKYDIGDIVYIIVPEGNFDKKITILSQIDSEVSKSSSVEGELYVRLGDSLFGNIMSEDLCSRRVENIEIAGDKSFFSKTFTEYLKDNRTFDLSCNIRTNIDTNRRSNGNYGLILNIPVVDLNGVSSNYGVTLDINNILGNAYNFNVKALQHLYFTIPAELSFDSNNLANLTLIAFVKDFPGQDSIDPSTGEYIGDRIVDIWISEIGVYPTKVVSMNEKEGYFLKARATEGSLFWGGSASTKELYPDLYLNGRSTETKPFECYWFKENYRIGVRTEGWHQYGGAGWQILNASEKVNDTESGDSNKNYISQERYTISLKEIHSDLRFKCVLVKDDIIISDIITIRNLIDPAEFTLTTDTGSTVYTKGIPNSKVVLVVKYTDSDISDDSSLQYEFTRFNQEGKLIEDKDENGKYKEGIFHLESEEANEQVTENNKIYLVTKFSLPVKEIYNMNTIYCTAYKSQKNADGTEISSEVVATASIGLSTAKAPSFQIVLENADKVYKYDIDGDSPMVADYDGPASSHIKAITPISARAYKSNGEEFTEDEYNISTITWKISKNSLIVFNSDNLAEMRLMSLPEDEAKEYYIISGSYPQLKNLYYSIASVYSSSKNENTIRVNIKMQDLSIDGLATIKFLKDGESGTNGSKFTAIVEHGASLSEAKGYEEIEFVEEIDEEGKVTMVERMHKIQLICVEPEGEEVEWYLYNSATDEYKRFTRTITSEQDYKNWIQFLVQMYCDGEPLPTGSFQTRWDIFDFGNSYTNVVSPITIDDNGIIYIRYEDDSDHSKGLIKWPKVTSSDSEEIPKVCAATIVASCQAKKTDQDNASDNNAMFEKSIRAYYPIEVTYSKTRAIVTEKLIPRLNGGFYQVVYNTEGSNPSYNSNKNFTFEDRLTDTASELNSQTYQWGCSESIKIEDVLDENNEVKLLEKRVTPTGRRFPDNKGCQYIKVNFGYDVDPRAVSAELIDYKEKKNELSSELLFSENIEGAATIIKDFPLLYEEIKNRITSNDNILLLKQQLEEFFIGLISDLDNLIEFNSDILSNAGIEYLRHLNGRNGIYEILTIASRGIGESDYTAQGIQNTFSDYGSIEACHLDGHYKGIYIDVNSFKNNSAGYYKTGIDKNKKASFIANIETFNSKINQFYDMNGYGYYYQIVNNLDEKFSTAFSLYDYVQDTLNGYLEDKKENNQYTKENGDYTYEDKISGDLISRWDVLTEEFVVVTIEEEGTEVQYIIENPYYSKFYYIYDDLEVIINNMKANKFSSYSKIIKVLDSINDLLYLYYNFSVDTKNTTYNQDIDALQKEIDGLEELANNYNVSSLIHVKPIIMLLNPTATWLDWDGNKIKIDEEGAYIAAPIFAAGKYEASGNFTGLTMGVQREEVDRRKQRVGLLGHYDGKQSLFIDAETGKAEFGLVETGQIIIDPQTNKLQIYDSYYNQSGSTSGMCINFAERAEGGGILPGYIHFKDAAGKIYSGQHNSQASSENGFYLSHDGFSIGANIHIYQNGTFIFGNMNKNNGQYIEWNGSTFKIGEKVQVTANAINADSTITCGGKTPTFKVEGTTGDLFAGGGNFQVSGSGNVNIAGNVNIGTSGVGNININGILSAREGSWIGNWKIAENGKLLGYNSQSDGSYSSQYDYATIRLDPHTYRLGFYTGACRDDDPNKHDFAYVGAGRTDVDDDDESKNTICIYTTNDTTNDNYGKLKAKTVYTNYMSEIIKIYIGCKGKNDVGKNKNEGAILITKGGIKKWYKGSKGWNWYSVLDF